ncbi:MAG: tetratricopeptide repeat protein [Kiritimatiellae bacterium]|nr:tetratricopeptide repeat protein [Kiritimatiellia bacterium]
MIGSLLALAITVLPSDRMAMADRLFNRGQHKEAEAEYRALVGAEGIAADEILFRLAECDRASGRSEAALKGYVELFTKYPDSSRAARARFLNAMGRSGLERRKLLAELDSDRVDLETRTAALYHLGSETSNPDLLAKCVKLAPKGTYAPYANLKYGTLLNESSDPAQRRKGLEVLLGVAFGTGDLADEALYLAAIQCYREKKYGEAGSLFLRYRRRFPKGGHFEETRSMSAWCDFLQGRYADAAATCGAGGADDLDYIKAACAYSTGESETALRLFRKYLEDYPQGAYRANAELPIARIEFDAAQKTNDVSKTIETAKRGFALSKLAADQLRLAWAYEKAGKPADAAAEYAAIAKSFPGGEEAAEAMYRKAMIDARAGNWSAAELALAEAMASGKLGRRTAEATYWRGVAAMKLGHEVEGSGFLENAVAAGLGLDESREARLMVADFDYRSGRIDQAKTSYRKLVQEGACERMSAARILSVGKLLGGAEAETCAKALTKGDSAEWRQAGWALLGDCEAKREAYAAAIESYRKCLAENAKTESAAAAALALGKLESRAGEFDRADATLKTAVSLNTTDARARAEAYLALARNAGAKGDWKSAVAYATVVTSLFDDAEFCAEAKKIVEEHPEAAQ